MLIDGVTLPTKLIKTDSFKPVFSVLSDLKRKIPIRVLKNMKNMVYDFVKSSSPKVKVFVTDDLDKIEEQNSAEFVYGVGIMDKLSKKGLKGITVDDLIKDYLFDENKFNSEDICFEWFPEQKGGLKYIPYFKHLKVMNLIGNDKKLKKNKKFSDNFIKKINDINLKYFEPGESYKNKESFIKTRFNDLDGIFKDKDLKDVNKYIYPLLLQPENINLDNLKSHLKQNFDKEKNGSTNISNYRKLVCYYDYLKYNYFV